MLFDAWLNRHLSLDERIISVWRARFFLNMWREYIVKMSSEYEDLYSTSRSFISPQAFQIFNRLCDSFILLVLAYAEYYPTTPFVPSSIGTHFVEHFFGVARTILPDFTFSELLKMFKHIMLREEMLKASKLKDRRDKPSASGYHYDREHVRPLTEEELIGMRVPADIRIRMGGLVEVGHKEALSLCRQILRMPVPSTPQKLIRVGAVCRAPSKHLKRAQAVDDDSESDSTETESEDEDEADGEAARSTADPAATPLSEAEDVAAVLEDATRLSALAEDFDATVKELPAPRSTTGDLAVKSSKALLPIVPASTTSSIATPAPRSPKQSDRLGIFDGKGKICIASVIKLREAQQSGTRVKSERVVVIRTDAITKAQQLKADLRKAKLAMGDAGDSADTAPREGPEGDNGVETSLDTKKAKSSGKLDHRAASHHVAVTQKLELTATEKDAKKRHARWIVKSTNITKRVPEGGTVHLTFISCTSLTIYLY